MNKKSIIFKSSISGLLMICLLLFLPFGHSETYESLPKLNGHCPPGFKRNANNECMSQNLYMQYDSPNNMGLGGLRTGLPGIRDGFSPQDIDLGRSLFFVPVVSGVGSISCGGCHEPTIGFSEGMAPRMGRI